MFPQEAVEMTGAELEVFEATGHDPHWEEPAGVARLVAAFLKRHTALTPA